MTEQRERTMSRQLFLETLYDTRSDDPNKIHFKIPLNGHFRREKVLGKLFISLVLRADLLASLGKLRAVREL